MFKAISITLLRPVRKHSPASSSQQAAILKQKDGDTDSCI